MAWVILFVAGLLEIGWAVGLKYTDGWSEGGALSARCEPDRLRCYGVTQFANGFSAAP